LLWPDGRRVGALREIRIAEMPNARPGLAHSP